MKIGVKKLDYDKVLKIKPPKRHKPMRQNFIFRVLIKLLSELTLRKNHFSYTVRDMEKAGDEPSLIFMNHSSFVDFEIASSILFPKPFSIVCTSDGFVGKELLMRIIGCIPTKKYVSDPSLISDMRYSLKEKKQSVLMYPEASYRFDGRATALPRRMGLLLKRLDVPLLMIKTEGAFTRQPLYNCLRKRRVDVSAEFYCLLSREEIKEKSVDEIDEILDKAFCFDGFRYQQENGITVSDPNRAEGLDRILFKCSECGSEGKMEGKGAEIKCHSCGKVHILDEFGYLKSLSGDTRFPHIPDWYSWQREQVRAELISGEYSMECRVKICMLADFKKIYEVGEGILRHDTSGFRLTGCNGRLDFTQSAASSYGLYADYFWYELGDVICIGDSEHLYYCFPQEKISVAKARMAAEELYKLAKKTRKKTVC